MWPPSNRLTAVFPVPLSLYVKLHYVAPGEKKGDYYGCFDPWALVLNELYLHINRIKELRYLRHDFPIEKQQRCRSMCPRFSPSAQSYINFSSLAFASFCCFRFLVSFPDDSTESKRRRDLTEKQLGLPKLVVIWGVGRLGVIMLSHCQVVCLNQNVAAAVNYQQAHH